MFGWEWKSRGMEKVSLYKFTHTPLLKNDGQLIQKSDKQPKKKHSPNLLKNKNHVQKKKSCLVKEKQNNYHTHSQRRKKKAMYPPTAQEIKK